MNGIATPTLETAGTQLGSNFLSGTSIGLQVSFVAKSVDWNFQARTYKHMLIQLYLLPTCFLAHFKILIIAFKVLDVLEYLKDRLISHEKHYDFNMKALHDL